MDTRVLKEPRGFMRCLEWLFAIIAFATCVDFSTESTYTVTCANGPPINITHPIAYPFRLDHDAGQNVTCTSNTTSASAWMYPPGDFSSDAQFFVFTGVMSFFITMFSLVVYVFFSPIYSAESKKAPLVDFVATVIVAVFWLSASAAWANGVLGLQTVANPSMWIYRTSKFNNTICTKKDDAYINAAVRSCAAVASGRFAKANVSILIGFLNFFLWTSNLWFLYKETSWFAARSGQPQATQMPS